VADDVEDDDLRPPPAHLDPGLARVTGGGDLGRVQLEILSADPSPAPDDRALSDLGGEDAQHQREPTGPCVHSGLEADPVDAMPGQGAEHPADDLPPDWWQNRDHGHGRDQDDHRPGRRDSLLQFPDASSCREAGCHLGAEPPKDSGGTTVHLDEHLVQRVRRVLPGLCR
jgi:hypothetical protein